MRHKLAALLLGSGLLWGQYTYRAFFIQQYYRAGDNSAPDSLDIYLFIERSGSGTEDTLASSNFPFFYNTAALNFANARILHRNKFHDNNYYAPLTYSVSGGRVNVSVVRKIGFTPPGHVLGPLDTIIAFRVPLVVCGPSSLSLLRWDSGPAAVLNSLLQSLKPRITWQDDEVALCPPLSATVAFTSPSSICEGAAASFSFRVVSPLGYVRPDSFIISVQRTAPSPLPPQVYPDIASLSGGEYLFSLTFPTAGSYQINIIGADKKCKCIIPLNNSVVTVSPLPSPVGILGRDSVYAGGVVSYSLAPSPASASWFLIAGGNSTSLGSGLTQSVTFPASPSTPRVDTILVNYTVSGSPCSATAYKPIVVLSCPSSGGSIQASASGLCIGQSAILQHVNPPLPPESLRWGKIVGNSWTPLPLSEGRGHSTPIYITPELEAGTYVYQVRLHYGGCVLYSAPETVIVSGEFLRREFYGLTPSVCAGDTAQLTAEGRGVWITPNGKGRFTDTLAPRSSYASSPDDPSEVQICWVIRSDDVERCRDRSKDTICYRLTVNPSDAEGRFSIPSSDKVVCFGGRVRLRGEIIRGRSGLWLIENRQGILSPSDTSQEVDYSPGIGEVGRWVRISWKVNGLICGSAIYTDSIFVESGTQLIVSAPNQICEGVNLSLSVLPPDTNVLWFRGSARSVEASGDFTETNPRFAKRGTFYEAGRLPVGNDTFVVFLRQGSCVSITEYPVTVIPAPRAFFTVEPSITTMNNPRIRFISQSEGAVSYTWDFGDFTRLTTDSARSEVEHVYRAPGVYSVVLYVENNLRCSDIYVCTECIQILPRRVYLPNAFSPNGDGKNDVFRILPAEEGFRFSRLEVFDRWGQVVFAGDNISEWKGEAQNGQPLEPGAYSYRAIILIPDEGLFTYTGVVHIVR